MVVAVAVAVAVVLVLPPRDRVTFRKEIGFMTRRTRYTTRPSARSQRRSSIAYSTVVLTSSTSSSDGSPVAATCPGTNYTTEHAVTFFFFYVMLFDFCQFFNVLFVIKRSWTWYFVGAVYLSYALDFNIWSSFFFLTALSLFVIQFQLLLWWDVHIQKLHISEHYDRLIIKPLLNLILP